MQRRAPTASGKGARGAYTAGAEKVLERASARGWTVASVKNDWKMVF